MCVVGKLHTAFRTVLQQRKHLSILWTKQNAKVPAHGHTGLQVLSTTSRLLARHHECQQASMQDLPESLAALFVPCALDIHRRAGRCQEKPNTCYQVREGYRQSVSK